MNGYVEAWKRYAEFSGRSSVAEFWQFFGVNFCISLVFIVLEIFFKEVWKVEAIYSLLVFLPMLSVTVRRLQDTNRSAWWLLVVLLPAVGMVVLIILLALPSEPDNDVGHYPQNSAIQ
ncbi:MAG: DUF805 domain-containing protein [Oceanospirillaceae bacterium]|nr:DUF805 domain-containing protein [Oceanospirillaceae bacterium]